MKIIERYLPPTPAALAQLKDRIGATSQTMAELTGLSQGGQWRKYTGGTSPRAMGMHMHFYLAALLALDDDALAQVIATMRGQGAQLEVVDGPALHVDFEH